MLKIKTDSLAFKTSAVYILLTILMITMIIVVAWENQLDIISRNTELNAKEKSNDIRAKLDKILYEKSELTSEILKEIYKQVKELNIHNFSLYSEKGKILFETKMANSDRQIKGKINDRERLNIDKCIYQNTFLDKAFYHDMLWDSQDLFRVGPKWSRIKYLDLYIPGGYGNTTVVMRVRMEFTELIKQRKHLMSQTLLIGLIIILLHIIFGVAISQMILRPIFLLNQATSKIAKGELKAHVNILRNDEIGTLAISFNEMAVALQNMREADRGANPLTGLPGNVTIANEIDKRLTQKLDIAVLYGDLDNFKAYNDKYGFTRGDDAILYTRDCFIDSVKTKGTKDAFVGHEGGDDFVVITNFDNYEQLARTIIASFDRDIAQFYNEIDARNGYIESVNRQGMRQRFPLMSLSLAIVSNHFRNFKNHAELVSVVAEMKKVVKKYEGSNFAIDKRTTR
ncbi:MAG: HAMP domain-containing protein [bacterium]